MSWSRAELFAWLDATEPMVDRLTPFELLEIPPTASTQHVQRAFHAIAATRHPDVWRNHLDGADRERLIHVYSRVTAAYAMLKNEEHRARILREVREKRPSQPPQATAVIDRGETSAPRASRTTIPTEPPSFTPPPMAEGPVQTVQTHATLGARALGFYRRAEAAQRVGDIAGALLNLRMALAAEPQSQFLKTAIADTQRRLKKS